MASPFASVAPCFQPETGDAPDFRAVRSRHRLSRAGNRRINRVLPITAVVQLRNQTKGRTYYDERRPTECRP
jgi:hypothetical protein